MVKWGLKTSILLNLAFLLFFGMLMLDWVFVTLARQALLDTELARCSQVLAAVEGYLDTDPKIATDLNLPDHGGIERAMKRSPVVALALQPPGGPAMAAGLPTGSAAHLATLARQARQNGERDISYGEGGTAGLLDPPERMFLSQGLDRGASA